MKHAIFNNLVSKDERDFLRTKNHDLDTQKERRNVKQYTRTEGSFPLVQHVVGVALVTFAISFATVEATPASAELESIRRAGGSSSSSLSVTESVQEKNQRWYDYLRRLESENSSFSNEHVQKIREVWDRIVSEVGEEIEIPAAGPTPEDAIELVWDLNRHHLEIDINSDGSLEWFYRDRETDVFDGEEGVHVENFPEELATYLRYFV